MSLFKKNQSYSIFYIICMTFSTVSLAQTYSKPQLQTLALEYLSAQLPKLTQQKRELTALTLDSRIPDKQCDSPLQISTAHPNRSNRQATVQIKCLDEKKWSLYVQVKIMELAEIITTNKNLAKGQVITADDLTLTMKATHLIRPQYLNKTELKSLLGSRSKRNLRQGSALTIKQICMVCKGDQVTIFAKMKGLTIKTTGFALQDGIIGQNINVKNAKSGKTLQVKVLGVDQVQVSI